MRRPLSISVLTQWVYMLKAQFLEIISQFLGALPDIRQRGFGNENSEIITATAAGHILTAELFR